MSTKLPRIPIQCPTCGQWFETTQSRINRDRGRFCSRSCGAKVNSRRHGHTTKTSSSRTYTSWASMLQRCRNPKATKFPAYGGAGITVSDDWLSFDRFLEDMGERPIGTTLDRIDGSLGYSKENCRWVSPREQMENTRRNVLISYNGTRLPMSALADMLGVNRDTLAYRIKVGWSEDRWAE